MVHLESVEFHQVKQNIVGYEAETTLTYCHTLNDFDQLFEQMKPLDNQG